jgi:lipopolysaccharide transport system ATP-binding protein
MPAIPIRVENLGKKYTITHKANERYTALRDVIANKAKTLCRGLISPSSHGRADAGSEEFWALRDVSFEVKQGEVVGIIGPNGAGKSTLLKILSRITEPTIGRVRLNGRVASLLEVGTGFHPELTGRENIFLNGAILGMTRGEIKGKFDEIVAFAETEKFLDTPVKRYSSGMYVRLAFAVAAHLDPEILLVDEVLAVGDTQFQRKCLGKVGEVSRQGRTVLLVSHNMAAMANLCQTAYLLKYGQIETHGPSQQVIERYIKNLGDLTAVDLALRKDRKGDGRLRFAKAAILDRCGTPIESAVSGQDVSLAITYTIPDKIPKRNVSVGISFFGNLGGHLFTCWTEMLNANYPEVAPGEKILCEIPRLPLSPGEYSFNLYCEINGSLADWLIHAGHIHVIEGDFFSTGRLPPSTHSGILVNHRWQKASHCC